MNTLDQISADAPESASNIIMDRGHVYIMQSREPDIVKVGWSSKPTERAQTLGYNLSFSSPKFLFPARVEATAHRHLRRMRVDRLGNEHFRTTIENARKAVVKAYPFHTQIDLSQYPAGSTWATDDFGPISLDPYQIAELVGFLVERGISVDVQSQSIRLNTPLDARLFIAGLAIGARSRSMRTLSTEEAARRGGHNRISDEARKVALSHWNNHALTVPDLVKVTGYGYSTLRNWFADEYPRPDKRGRPRKR